MDPIVLRCIAGPQTGKEFSLKPDSETVIGRADEVTIVVPDDSVSRKHAVITCRGDEIIIEDYSRNGTFINGLRVIHSKLHPQDQIQIGHTVLKLIAPSRQPAPAAKPTPQPLPTGTTAGSGFAPFDFTDTKKTAVLPAVEPTATLARLPRPANTPPDSLAPTPAPSPVGRTVTENFRGSIGDLALVDLLQLLTSTRKSGCLVIRSSRGIGSIFLEKGKICHAQMEGKKTTDAHKIFYRILRWNEGIFELESLQGREFPITIDESSDFLLLEAMRQVDEITNLGADLLPYRTQISLASPLPAPLRDLSSGDLDFIQLAIRHKTVGDILDNYGGSDFEGYTYLIGLIGRKFLVASMPTP